MDTVSLVLNQIIIMFLLIFIGTYLKKIELFSNLTVKELNEFLMKFVVCAAILSGFNLEFDKALVLNLFLAILLAFLSHLIFIIVSMIAFKGDDLKHGVSKVTSIFTNCSFMAFPLIIAVFGNEGLLYATGYLVVFNITLWGYGFTLIERGEKQTFSQVIKRIITQPVIIATLIGLTLFSLNITLPWQISSVFSSISAVNTPIAMILLGFFVTETNIFEIFKNKYILFLCAMRLLILPFLVILMLKVVSIIFPLSEVLLMTLVICASCPCGTISAMLCKRYDLDSSLAVQAITLSTLLSIITIPTMIFVANCII